MNFMPAWKWTRFGLRGLFTFWHLEWPFKSIGSDDREAKGLQGTRGHQHRASRIQHMCRKSRGLSRLFPCYTTTRSWFPETLPLLSLDPH